MVIRVPHKIVSELIRKLEPQIPYSLQLYSLARAVTEKRWHNVDFFVDTWPEFSVVISKPSDDHEDFCKFTSTEYGIFSKNKYALQRMVRSHKLFDWNSPMSFSGVSISQGVLEELRQAAEAVGGYFDVLDTGSMFVVNAGDIALSKLAQPPPGMHFSPMSADDASIVHQDWAMSGHDDCLEFVKHLLENFPSSSLVFDPGDGQNRQMVGYAMMHHMGALSAVHIRPPYAGQHLLSSISSYMVKRCYDTGFSPYPFGFIPHENVSSWTHALSMDYRVVSKGDVAWCQYRPRLQTSVGASRS